MINSSHQTLCAKHNQRAVYYNRFASDPQAKYLCQICIVEENTNMMLMDDVKREIRQLKVNLQNDRRIESERISEYLEELLQDFHKYKENINIKIDKTITGIRQQLEIVKFSQNDFENKILNLPEDDINSFIQQYKTLKNSFINGREIKEKIQENIQNILNLEQFKQTLQLVQKLSEIHKEMSSEILESFKNRVSHTISSSQISYSNCTNHQGLVVNLVNMNQAINIQNRLACKRCRDENPTQQYITIGELYDKYVIYEKSNLEMMNNFNQKLNQQKLDFQNLLQLINSKISNFQKILKTQELNCYQKLKFNSKIWHTYKAEEIAEIAEIISQQDQQNNFEQSISNQFNCCQSKIKAEFDTLLAQIQDLRKNSAIIIQSNTQDLILGPQIIQNSQFGNEQRQLLPQSQPNQISLAQMIFFRQFEDCWAIEINQNCSTIFASAQNLINVLEFQNYQINQIQTLNNHKGWVTNLNLMKKSNQLLSGSIAHEIIIWNQKNNNKWEYFQTIQLQSVFIKCLIININENIIIFAGSDKKISFWNKNYNQDWNLTQIIQDHKGGVYGLSLNDNQDKLISCGDDQQILISQFYQQLNGWKVIQCIPTNTFGYRICFITDNVFSFQPTNKEQLHFYELNQQNYKYEFKTSVQVNYKKNESVCFFPQQFIKKKQILINKNGQFINFIKRQKNGQFVLLLSLQFQTDNLYGKVSEDGEYLITWDWSSKNFQVQKLTIQ